MITAIHPILRIIHSFYESAGIETHFVLPENFAIDTTGFTDLPVALTDDKIGMLRKDPKSLHEQMMVYHIGLEEYIIVLVRIAVMRTDKRTLDDMHKHSYAIINHLENNPQLEYYFTRISYHGYPNLEWARRCR